MGFKVMAPELVHPQFFLIPSGLGGMDVSYHLAKLLLKAS
jgi:hypothetical protein